MIPIAALVIAMMNVQSFPNAEPVARIEQVAKTEDPDEKRKDKDQRKKT